MRDFKELYDTDMQELESIARPLFAQQLTDADAIWQFEVTIARFQVKLQKEIDQAKQTLSKAHGEIKFIASNKIADWKDRIKEQQNVVRIMENTVATLTHVHKLSRQVGDAFAWALFELHTRKIMSLGHSQKAVSTTSGMSLLGMIVVAEKMASGGAGFPILHDITDCLRVGDITFVKPNEEPMTIEIKTRVNKREGKTTWLTVEMYGTTAVPRYDEVLKTLTSAPEQVSEEQPSDLRRGRGLRWSDPQLRRQLDRMAHAIKLQGVASGDFVESAGDKQYIIELPTHTSEHRWDVLLETLREAKDKGFAGNVVDDAYVIFAFYNSPPTIYPWEQASSEIPPLEKFRIYLEGNFPVCSNDENFMTFRVSLDQFEGKAPQDVRPLLLLPVPVDLLMDLLWCRLIFIVATNVGKLAEALRNAGIAAEIPKNARERNTQLLSAQKRFAYPDGSSKLIILPELRSLIARIEYEFVSKAEFVRLVDGAFEQMSRVEPPQNSAKDADEIGSPPAAA